MDIGGDTHTAGAAITGAAMAFIHSFIHSLKL